MIRFSLKNESPAFVEEINKLTYKILMDLEIEALQYQSEDKVFHFLNRIFFIEGNRFSYHNILVKELDEHIVGIAIMYHGKDSFALDFNLTKLLVEEFKGGIKLCKEAETDEFYLDTLAVSTEYQNRGIGTELIKTFEEIGYKQGHSKYSLNVEENNRANHLYEKLGYKFEKNVNLYGHNYIHLVKKLNEMNNLF